MQPIINFIVFSSGYMTLVAVIILPTLLVIIIWKLMDFLIGRFGDRALYAFAQKRRFKKMGDNKTREELLHSLRTLEPKEFEYYMASFFRNAGFEAKVVGGYGHGDGGIDIVLTRDGSTSFVQCKKYIGKDIGVAQARDFYGAIADQLHADKKSKGYFMTTTYFTEDAKKFAKGRRIVLYDGDDLMDAIFYQEGAGNRVDLGEADRSVVLRNIPPICPVCRRSLVWRTGGYNSFIGCTGYPQCHYVFSQNIQKVDHAPVVSHANERV